mmetsp:Transcript_12413/g.13382  ORF Transcript_12413/g.13382 Transcript_12413/m.13382 type:complete len:83 (+) Transcript_12413:1200-1448(+)
MFECERLLVKAFDEARFLPSPKRGIQQKVTPFFLFFYTSATSKSFEQFKLFCIIAMYLNFDKIYYLIPVSDIVDQQTLVLPF